MVRAAAKQYAIMGWRRHPNAWQALNSVNDRLVQQTGGLFTDSRYLTIVGSKLLEKENQRDNCYQLSLMVG